MFNNDQTKFTSCWQRRKKLADEVCVSYLCLTKFFFNSFCKCCIIKSNNDLEELQLLDVENQQLLNKRNSEGIKKEQSFTSMKSSQSDQVDSSELKTKYTNNHIYILDTNNLILNNQVGVYT